MLPSTVIELSPAVWLIGILAGILLLTLAFHARRQSQLRRAMDDQYWEKVKERKLHATRKGVPELRARCRGILKTRNYLSVLIK